MRRRAILDAAMALFAEKGYTHATLDEIAQRAEFGKGTLYNYFEGGKEEIMRALFDDLYDEMHLLLRESFTPARLQNGMREAFREFLVGSFEFFLERRDVFLLMMKVAHRMVFSEDESLANYFKAQRDRLIRGLTHPIELGIARGEFKPSNPIAVAHTIMGNIQGIQMHLWSGCSRAGEQDPDDLDTPEKAADFLISMLFDGLMVREPETITNQR